MAISVEVPAALAVADRPDVSACADQKAAVDAVLAGADPNHSHDDWSVRNDAVYQDARPDEPTDLVALLLGAGADPKVPGYPPVLCAVNQEWSSGSVLRQLADADLVATALDLVPTSRPEMGKAERRCSPLRSRPTLRPSLDWWNEAPT